MRLFRPPQKQGDTKQHEEEGRTKGSRKTRPKQQEGGRKEKNSRKTIKSDKEFVGPGRR